MHWRLSPDFSQLSEVDLRAHDALFDRLLHVHIDRRHLFCLSPAEVVLLRRAIQFGPLGTRALHTILRKSQDYAASARAASRHLVLMPMGSASRDPVGKEFYVRSEDAAWWLEHAPVLCVENSFSDGKIYSFLLARGAHLIGSSANYVMVRPFHGGGNPLGNVMDQQYGEMVQGLCICDRDSSNEVPPYAKDSTSEHAYTSLLKNKVIRTDGSSDPRNPFFKFIITFGWGVENYIGPHVLQLFFEKNSEARQKFLDFISVFENFPNLSDAEMRQYMTINMKSEKQDAALLASGLLARFEISLSDDAHAKKLASLSIPDSVIPFVCNNTHSGRFKSDVIAAFNRDLKNDIYKASIETLSRLAIDALAADVQINFA